MSLERTYLAGREYMTVPVEMDNDTAVVRYAEVNDDPLVVVRALDKEGSRNVYVHVDMARRMKVTLAGNQVQRDVTDWRRARPVL